MRKKLVLLLILCFALLLCFASCKSQKNDLPDDKDDTTVSDQNDKQEPKEPTDAASLYEMIDKKMVSLESYEIEQKMRFIYYVYGTKIESEAEVKVISLLKDEKSPFYYQYLVSELKTDDNTLNQTTSSFTGYKDGKMYLMNDNGEPTQKLCATVSKADFEDYIDSDTIKDLELLDCKDSTFAKNENGTWTLNFSGYTKKSINNLMDELGVDEFEGFLDILDMKVTIEADEQYRATSLRMEFVFDAEEGSNEVPELIMVQNYSKYGEVDKNSVSFDTAGYTEVSDLMILNELEEKLDEIYDLENGKFTLDINQTLKANGTTVSEHKESDTIFYGKENGGYFFSLDGEINQVKVSIRYKNGTQVTTVGEQSQNATITDSQAKDMIVSLIDSVKYDPDIISNIEKVSNDEYKFEIKYADKSLYEGVFTQLSVTDKGAKQTVRFILKDGKITKIVGELVAIGEVIDGNTPIQVELRLVSETAIDYQLDGGTAA
jgi:Txe/YoeB family toxin of Txe-Axe toxin-antitoxin module